MPQSEKINLYDIIAEDYGRKRKKPWNLFLEFYKELQDLFPLDFGKQGKIYCDLGCGTGRHMEFLAEKADIYIGTDNSFSSLNIAFNNKRKNIDKIQLLHCDIEHLPFRSGKISIVHSIAVIHHILSRTKRKRVNQKINIREKF